MAKKPTPKKPRSKKPLASTAEVNVVASRSWTEEEMRLPLWLRDTSLPHSVVAPAIKAITEYGLPLQQGKLVAIVQFAQAAEKNFLAMRRDHGSKSKTNSPEVYIQNIEFLLRSARDDLLLQTPPAHIAVVSMRLDSMIDATKRVFAAYMSEPLNRIVCDNPKCKKRGKHLLPGPWTETSKRSWEAAEDAMRLSSFVDVPGDANDSFKLPSSGQEGRFVVLNDIDVSVLQFLSKQRTARSRIYIADNLPNDRVSVSSAAKRLIHHEFVEDRGRNSGIAISASGRAWLSSDIDSPKRSS